MANLTINVDEQLIKAARVRAIQQGTSLSAKVREFLQQYVNEAEASRQMLRDAATARLMAAIDAAASEAQPAAQPRRRCACVRPARCGTRRMWTRAGSRTPALMAVSSS